MTISIDFSSPIIRIKGLETKYDFVGASNSFIRVVGDYLPGRIIQQFHFWLGLNKGGIAIDGYKWIYKSQLNLRTEAVVGFTEYQVRKANNFLLGEGILIRQQLHREHYGAKHACAAYNRQYYYRLDYEALRKFLVRQIKKLRLQISFVKPPKTELVAHPLLDGTLETEVDQPTATNTETVGLANTANQIRETHQSVSRMSPNITNTTVKNDRSNTPPLAPQNQEALTREKTLQNQPVTPENTQAKKQDKIDSPNAGENSVNSKPIPFTDVVARPPRVEQKVNKSACTVQKPVQDKIEVEIELEVEAEAESVSTPLATNVTPEVPQKARHKVKKGTLPQVDFGQAPWTSRGQLKKFVRSLYESNFIKRQAQNRDALINWVLILNPI